MDFIVGLLENQGYNVILILVNRLIKIKHLIFYTDIISSKDLVWLYLKEI